MPVSKFTKTITLSVVFFTAVPVLADKYTIESVFHDHPLSTYLNKEGVKVIQLFGDPNRCDKSQPTTEESFQLKSQGPDDQQRRVRCQKALDFMVSKAKKYSVDMEADDFLSESYRVAFTHVKKSSRDYFYSLPWDKDGLAEKSRFAKEQNTIFNNFKK